MTTPRDDIAGLSEGLRIYAKHAMPCFPNDLCSEAATQLDSLLKGRDALQAEVKDQREGMVTLAKEHLELARDYDKLQARVKELEGQLRTVQNAAKTIAACQGTELEHLRQNRTFDHKLRAEHESLLTRDAMMTEALEAAESRASRLQQERDEAIKLIRPLTILAEDTARVSSKHGSEFAPEMSSLAARARSFVRRLGSPEKIAAANDGEERE